MGELGCAQFCRVQALHGTSPNFCLIWTQISAEDHFACCVNRCSGFFFSNFNFSRLQNHPPSDQRERDQPHDSAETGELLRRTVARHNNNRGESKVKEFPQLIVRSVTSHEEFVNPFTLSCYHLLMHFHIPHAACVGTQLVYKHLSMHPIAARGRLSLV